MKIVSGKQTRPQKVVIYGSEGIGKSTLASKFPAPVFADVEGGTAQLDVARITDLANWQDVLSTVAEFAASEDVGKTLVVDTVDKAELMCVEHICAKFKKGGIEEFGYGKGYTYLQEEFKKLLDLADECIKHGKNVVLLAHAKMRKFEQPDEMGAYDRWEMKLTKQVAPLVKEWADMVLFLNYQTTVVNTNENKKKAVGGRRVIYTNHHPCWDAKNRHGLPEELPLEWASPLSDIFVETANATVSAAAHVFGGEITDQYGNPVNKLSRADTVRELARRSDISEEQVILALIKNDMTGENTKSLDEVDEDQLQEVINYWDDFKSAAADQDIEVPF